MVLQRGRQRCLDLSYENESDNVPSIIKKLSSLLIRVYVVTDMVNYSH